MDTKMGPQSFCRFYRTPFFSHYHGLKPELYGRYIDDCIGATSSTREEPTQFITAVNSFHPALKYTWEISDSFLAFPDIKISIKDNGYVLVFTTNLQIHIVTSCIHLRIHQTSRIPYLFHSFSDFVVYIGTILIFRKISGNVPFSDNFPAILFPSFKRATIVPSKLIDSKYYKQLRRKTLTVFHLLSHYTLTITLLNQPLNSLRWQIYVFNSVVDTKLPEKQRTIKSSFITVNLNFSTHGQ